MQARRLWITGPHAVSIEAFALPDRPGPDQVLLRTERTLVSAGTELAIVTGSHIGFTTGAAWPHYPMALGYTAIGRVLAVGPSVSGVREGDRVLAPTPHASHAVVAGHALLAVPGDVGPDAALLAHLASIPMNGVRLAQPRLGDGMIVFGQGLIGALAARIGHIAGCRPVLGVDPLPDRRQIAQAGGVIPVDPNASDPADVHRARANGRLAEIVVEATGAPQVITAALAMAGPLARVVLLGSPRGRVEIDPYTDIHRKGVSVIGAHANVAPSVATPYNPFTAERNRELALALIADGSLNVDGLVSHHIAPEQAAETYRALAARVPGYMGVVIDWER